MSRGTNPANPANPILVNPTDLGVLNILPIFHHLMYRRPLRQWMLPVKTMKGERLLRFRKLFKS
jgi:hypothetical protein